MKWITEHGKFYKTDEENLMRKEIFKTIDAKIEEHSAKEDSMYVAGGTEDLDPSEVVLDELIGVLIALAFVPWELPWVVAAFVLFRLFDIAKPGPVGWADRNLKNYVGIMLDDVIAGLLAGGVLIIARVVLGSA